MDMFRKLLTITFITICISTFSQVGIGTNTPNSSSILDVRSSTAGILIPRIALTNTIVCYNALL